MLENLFFGLSFEFVLSIVSLIVSLIGILIIKFSSTKDDIEYLWGNIRTLTNDLKNFKPDIPKVDLKPLENKVNALANINPQDQLKAIDSKIDLKLAEFSRELAKDKPEDIDTSHFILDHQLNDALKRIYVILNELVKAKLTKDEIAELKQRLSSGIKGEEYKETLARYQELKSQ